MSLRSTPQQNSSFPLPTCGVGSHRLQHRHMCTPAPTSLCMLRSTRQHARGTAESLMTTADSDSANGCASLGGWVNSRLTHCCGVSFLFPFAHCPNHSLTFPVKASTTAVTGTFVALSSRLPVLVCPFTQAHTYTRWCRCVHVRCARPEIHHSRHAGRLPSPA